MLSQNKVAPNNRFQATSALTRRRARTGALVEKGYGKLNGCI
jgi:hypothetical protein